MEPALKSFFLNKTNYQKIIESLAKDTFNTQKSILKDDVKLLNSYLREDKQSTLNIYENLEKINQTDIHQIIYIPVLRSALTFYVNEKRASPEIYRGDIYEKTIWELYNLYHRINPENENRFEVFTGKNLYEQIKTDLLSPRNTRDHFRAFEKFIGDVFFNEKIEIGVIDSKEDKKKHIRVYFEKDEKDIQNLGDGI